MMHKRTIYSLLLTSFVLMFAFGSALAQPQVDVGSISVLRCVSSSVPISVNSSDDLNAFEIILELNTSSGTAFLDNVNVVWNPGFTTLTNRIVDLSGVDGVSPDTIRIAAMQTGTDPCLLIGGSGSFQVASLEFKSSNDCSGIIDITGATAVCPDPDPGNPTAIPVSASTQFVVCNTNALVAAAVVGGSVTITNAVPTVNAINDTSDAWGNVFVYQVVADDNDLPNGCEVLKYGFDTNPTGMNINASSGLITWPIPGSAVCSNLVEVWVADSCGDTVRTSFSICVTNQPPVITCPNDTLIGWGALAEGDVTAVDPDNGPSPMLFSLVSFNGPGAITIDPVTGHYSWQTLFDSTYTGVFEVCVEVTDGANICDPCSPSSADTCCFTIRVVPFLLTIQKTHKTLQGKMETVEITMLNSNYVNYEIGGFDFLIAYDASALSFTGASRGQFLDQCGWEYFQYRYGASGNCGSGVCPSGKLRVVALAETNNGANHPSCFTNGPGISNQLVQLNFLVTNDRTLECQYVPIRWCWYDCGDNAISSVTGDTLFISRHIYEFEDTLGLTPIENPNFGYPTYFGAQADCDTLLRDGKPDPLRLVDFLNGGIDIACAESLDARGDINLNEIAYEIADAVVFTNYFIQGLSAFNINIEGQIAATDVNADGLALSVADLVYLIRVIVGDALPFPKATAEVVAVDAAYTHADNGHLAVVGGTSIGAAHLVVEGDVSPELLADNMTLRYNFDGENTRILVFSLEGNSFSGEFLTVNGHIVSIEMATEEGNPVNSRKIPLHFALNQNYPNPFNPSTNLSFTLPVRSAYTLNVYNVNGQLVTTFNGEQEAGVVEIVWDASNLASGIYFYKLQAGNFTDTKKMVLLK